MNSNSGRTAMATAALIALAPMHNGMMQSVPTTPETRHRRANAKLHGRVGPGLIDKAKDKRERRRERRRKEVQAQHAGAAGGRLKLLAKSKHLEAEHAVAQQDRALGFRK